MTAGNVKGNQAFPIDSQKFPEITLKIREVGTG